MKIPKPKNITEVRAFIGMVNFYGKFVCQLANILEPLYKLLLLFCWSKKCDVAFNKCKEAITSDNVLTHYDMTLPIKVCCDASQSGIGVVLLQQDKDGLEKPISFISRTLTEIERRYSVIHKEALAFYWSVNKL